MPNLNDPEAEILLFTTWAAEAFVTQFGPTKALLIAIATERLLTPAVWARLREQIGVIAALRGGEPDV